MQKAMSVRETERLKRELKAYMDIQDPGRRTDYDVMLAQLKRRIQSRPKDGLLTRLMVRRAMREETRRAAEEVLQAWANAHG